MFAQPKTSFSKKIIACLCALAFVASLMPVAAFAAPTQQEATAEDSALVAQADGKLDVTYHSEREIKNYYREHNINLNQGLSFSTVPNATSPYAVGAMSKTSLE